ncbi:DUF2516 family protein [Corynebacterium sp. CCM 9185]|uniref:DUF2516 family protein n=1 Tax=Corynebacterium marambiense TaxID=2765364 RepID=A0ABS0VS28_9CORY|nr:DUF2516 family protein [Corynebacterium marambiense]MBI8999581.1 DUF2516 family protein [Corynebacterium marambiense]MCK7662419.1 DUF2516 family protein [Corynebacterium marambiense]MCX7541705.1 DUF2516 family protein [Corynebacterium marambiense]
MFLYEAARVLGQVVRLMMAIIGIVGLVGAALCAVTRDDAFTAADRQQKLVWTGILVASAVAMFIDVQLLHWVGMVVIGLYWFDVRPQLKDIVDGENTW